MFNNGYNNFYPYQNSPFKQSLFYNLKGKFNWSNILNNTQKTLNIINQAIPVFYQIKPIWNNTKTIFKIMGAMKEDDKKNINNHNKYVKNSHTKNNNNTIANYNNLDNTPNFFL